jgi:hypothetical protein
MINTWLRSMDLVMLISIPTVLWLIGRSMHAFVAARRAREWSFEMPSGLGAVLATSQASRLIMGPLLLQIFALLYLLLGIPVYIFHHASFEQFSAWFARALLILNIVYQFMKNRPGYKHE